MWVKIEERLPEHNQTIIVKTFIGDKFQGFAIAEYSKHFGFSGDYSAYDVYCHDDSGLSISLFGEVKEWQAIEK